MKSILKKFAKRFSAGLAAVLLVAVLSSTVLAAFGPDRPTKAWSPTVAGFDHVTFNSFTGVGGGVGDERDFLRGVQVGRDSVWSDPVANVTQQAEVEAKIYIHNGADASLNDAPGNPGIARNVTVKVALPTGSNRTQDVTAFIAADNAQPQQVFDTLTMTGANNGYFEVAYVPGSAKFHKNGTSTTLTTAQEQALLSTGYNTGDQNGCFEFVEEITFRMKVNMPRHTIAKQVTLPGSTNWGETQNVNPGDTVSWLITVNNTGYTRLNRIIVLDEVPAGLTVVPGTVKLVNGNYPNGFVYPDSVIQANGRQVNVNIGDYNPDSGPAYVTYRTKVADAAALTCGVNTFTNKAFATPEGYGAIWDTAVATATRTCVPTTTTTTTPKPTALPQTGAGDVVGLFSAVTVAGALVHRRYFA